MENEIIQAKRTLTARIILGGIGIVLAAAIMIFSIFIADTNAGDLVHGYSMGFLTGTLLCCVYTLVNCSLVLANSDKVKKFCIRENDERRKLIALKSGLSTYPYIAFALSVGTSVAGWYSLDAFVALLCVLGFVSLLTVGLKIFYNFKY